MDVETLRMLERLLTVFGGVMSVYLGYRLFYIVKQNDKSEAKLKLSELADVSLKKVGPGIFFALFGAWILATSLTTKISTSIVGSTQLDPSGIQKSISRISELIDELPKEKRAKIREELTILEINLISVQRASQIENRNFIGLQPPPLAADGKIKG